MTFQIKEESLEMFSKFTGNQFAREDLDNFFNIDDLDDFDYNDDEETGNMKELEHLEKMRASLLKLAQNTKCYCGSGKLFKDCHGAPKK